jgi:hypothetical protein
MGSQIYPLPAGSTPFQLTSSTCAQIPKATTISSTPSQSRTRRTSGSSGTAATHTYPPPTRGATVSAHGTGTSALTAGPSASSTASPSKAQRLSFSVYKTQVQRLHAQVST